MPASIFDVEEARAQVAEGGGKRIAPGFAETRSGPRPGRSLGLEYLHVAVDDHSRYAYVAALPDERAATCAAFLERALAAFCRRGVRVRGVLTDNAKAYTVARRFLEAAAAADVQLSQTRIVRRVKPSGDRPQTNGKAERLHPDLAARVGIRPPLPLQRRAATRAPALALPLQSPPTARRRRRCRTSLAPVNNVPGNYS